MADSEYSSSGKTCVDYREETSEESKLKFSEDEETLIIMMFNLVGERWDLIAGRIPGRTAEEIKEYWNTRYSTSERKNLGDAFLCQLQTTDHVGYLLPTGQEDIKR